MNQPRDSAYLTGPLFPKALSPFQICCACVLHLSMTQTGSNVLVYVSVTLCINMYGQAIFVYMGVVSQCVCICITMYNKTSLTRTTTPNSPESRTALGGIRTDINPFSLHLISLTPYLSFCLSLDLSFSLCFLQQICTLVIMTQIKAPYPQHWLAPAVLDRDVKPLVWSLP